MAIALLFYTAAADSTASPKWKAANSLTHTRLSISSKSISNAPLTSLAGEPRHYWVATTTAYQSLATTALSEPAAGFDQANQAPPNPVKVTMQRSWTIIKLAFR